VNGNVVVFLVLVAFAVFVFGGLAIAVASKLLELAIGRRTRSAVAVRVPLDETTADKDRGANWMIGRTDMLTAMAVTIGVLIAIWVKVGSVTNVVVPIGIVAWALFYAVGGRARGLLKTIASTLSGVFWVAVAMTLVRTGNLGTYAWLLIGIVAMVMVLQSKIPWFSFIPGSFCGAAVTAWAAPTDVTGYAMVALSLVSGAAFGYLSELGVGVLARRA
jgi:uncharacterized protein DUF1097